MNINVFIARSWRAVFLIGLFFPMSAFAQDMGGGNTVILGKEINSQEQRKDLADASRIARVSGERERSPDYLYVSCKRSIKDKTFLTSHCRTAIFSAIAGMSFLMMDVMSYQQQEIETVNGRARLKLLKNSLCMDKNPDFKDVAIKYVHWYENKKNQKENPDSYKSAETSLVISIFDNYKCLAPIGE